MDKTLGKHIVADLYNVNELKLMEINKSTYDTFNLFIKNTLKESNINLLSQTVHHFDGYSGAFTALYLLAESHLSIHTWPEHKYIALDVFTCGNCDTQLIVDKLVEYFEPKNKKINIMIRGDISEDNNDTEQLYCS
jgi:S-adenosylmethionine decarboxylase